MPMSVKSCCRQVGFTLLEILVVVAIVGIVAGMATLSMSMVENPRGLRREMDRLTALVQLVSDEALLQGRDYGLLLEPDNYRFLVYNYDKSLWEDQGLDPRLRSRELAPGQRFHLIVEGQQVPLDVEEKVERLVPHIAILSSGEFTGFDLEMYTEFSDESEWLRGTMAGQLIRNPENMVER